MFSLVVVAAQILSPKAAATATAYTSSADSMDTAVDSGKVKAKRIAGTSALQYSESGTGIAEQQADWDPQRANELAGRSYVDSRHPTCHCFV